MFQGPISRRTILKGLGTAVAFLVWVYVQAAILLYGVEFTATYARLRRGRSDDVPATCRYRSTRAPATRGASAGRRTAASQG